MFKHAIVAVAALAALSCGRTPAANPSTEATATTASDQPRGTIRGHVRLMGTPPENPDIRMRADPMCETANSGRRVRFESVMTTADGSLANVFVRLKGSFPSQAAGTAPVTVDQSACLYAPRMVGIQVGQVLRVRNSDPGLHNVHGTTSGKDSFNVGQPMAGIVNEFKPKDEGMLKLQCDVHAWMVAYIGVVAHPYFAVSSETGTFEVRNVPAGTYPIEAWHERFGQLSQMVTVEPNGVTEVEFVYTADAQQK